MDVLAPEESRLPLSRTLGEARVEADPQAAADLSRVCGHLPLALRICAANLDHNPWRTLREQAEELSDGDRLTALSVTGDQATAVRNAFALSYEALQAPARRMFRHLALLPGPETGLPAVAVATGTTVREAARLLEGLTVAHLLREHQPGRYRLHDLIALYAAERLRLEETDAVRRSASDTLYSWLLAAVNRCAHLLYPGMKQLLPTDEHGGQSDAVAPLPEITDGAAAIRWLDAELPNLSAAVHQAAAAGHPAAWLLADALRGHSWTRKNAVDWAALGQAALAAAHAARQPRAEAAMHNLLGIAHIQQSRPDTSIAHLEQFLALAEAADWPEGAATRTPTAAWSPGSAAGCGAVPSTSNGPWNSTGRVACRTGTRPSSATSPTSCAIWAGCPSRSTVSRARNVSRRTWTTSTTSCTGRPTSAGPGICSATPWARRTTFGPRWRWPGSGATWVARRMC